MAFKRSGRKFTGGRIKMSSYRIIGTDGELCHSGTKGMHWGERLYQYSDGSLTPLGRIHYGVGASRDESVLARDKQIRKNKKTYKDSLKKANQRAKEEISKQAERDAKDSDEKSAKTESSSSSKKSISEMSNKELDTYITRLRKEKEIKDLENAVYGTKINSSENKQKSSTGERILKQVGESALKTVLTATVVYAAGGIVNAAAKDNVVKSGRSYNKEKKKAD